MERLKPFSRLAQPVNIGFGTASIQLTPNFSWAEHIAYTFFSIVYLCKENITYIETETYYYSDNTLLMLYNLQDKYLLQY